MILAMKGTAMKRSVKAAAVAATMTFAAGISTGVADAHIVWTGFGSELVDHHTGGCLVANGQGHASMINCGGVANYFAAWNLVSARPDTAGYANVVIQATGTNMCLVAYGHFTGPSQINGSSDVETATCNANDDSQIWAMTSAAPRSGNTAHLNFFTFGQRVCLDGGIGVYGFPESGCNPANDYQEWDYIHGQYNDDGSPI
jgi:hypothetical protein